MPTILLTNDDGTQSIGLITLKKRLEKLANVIVVAPRYERSGIGKALTTDAHIKIMRARRIKEVGVEKWLEEEETRVNSLKECASQKGVAHCSECKLWPCEKLKRPPLSPS